MIAGATSVWSVVVPIAVVHGLFRSRRHTPWLRRRGLVVVTMLYLLGAVVLTIGTYLKERFVASPAELAGVALAAGTAFFLLYRFGVSSRMLPSPVHVTLTLVLMLLIVALTAPRPGWTNAHTYALVTSAVLTYCWAGVLVQVSQFGYSPVTAVVQTFLITAAITLLVVLHRRIHA